LDPVELNSSRRSQDEARLAAEIERLRLDIQRPDGPALTDDEVRRRADAIADLFLALYGDPAEDAPSGPRSA